MTELDLLRLMLAEVTRFIGLPGNGQIIRGKTPRDVLRDHPEVGTEQARAWLEKWARDGFYDYIVILDGGWFDMSALPASLRNELYSPPQPSVPAPTP